MASAESKPALPTSAALIGTEHLCASIALCTNPVSHCIHFTKETLQSLLLARCGICPAKICAEIVLNIVSRSTCGFVTGGPSHAINQASTVMYRFIGLTPALRAVQELRIYKSPVCGIAVIILQVMHAKSPLWGHLRIGKESKDGDSSFNLSNRRSSRPSDKPTTPPCWGCTGPESLGGLFERTMCLHVEDCW